MHGHAGQREDERRAPSAGVRRPRRSSAAGGGSPQGSARPSPFGLGEEAGRVVVVEHAAEDRARAGEPPARSPRACSPPSSKPAVVVGDGLPASRRHEREVEGAVEPVETEEELDGGRCPPSPGAGEHLAHREEGAGRRLAVAQCGCTRRCATVVWRRASSGQRRSATPSASKPARPEERVDRAMREWRCRPGSARRGGQGRQAARRGCACPGHRAAHTQMQWPGAVVEPAVLDASARGSQRGFVLVDLVGDQVEEHAEIPRACAGGDERVERILAAEAADRRRARRSRPVAVVGLPRGGRRGRCPRRSRVGVRCRRARSRARAHPERGEGAPRSISAVTPASVPPARVPGVGGGASAAPPSPRKPIDHDLVEHAVGPRSYRLGRIHPHRRAGDRARASRASASCSPRRCTACLPGARPGSRDRERARRGIGAVIVRAARADAPSTVTRTLAGSTAPGRPPSGEEGAAHGERAPDASAVGAVLDAEAPGPSQSLAIEERDLLVPAEGRERRERIEARDAVDDDLVAVLRPGGELRRQPRSASPVRRRRRRVARASPTRLPCRPSSPGRRGRRRSRWRRLGPDHLVADARWDTTGGLPHAPTPESTTSAASEAMQSRTSAGHGRIPLRSRRARDRKDRR